MQMFAAPAMLSFYFHDFHKFVLNLIIMFSSMIKQVSWAIMQAKSSDWTKEFVWSMSQIWLGIRRNVNSNISLYFQV